MPKGISPSERKRKEDKNKKADTMMTMQQNNTTRNPKETNRHTKIDPRGKKIEHVKNA